jgi:hypothetical protein
MTKRREAEVSKVAEDLLDRSGSTFTSISAAVPMLAPLTVAFSGMLYVAGWQFEAELLRPFGLRPNLFERSLQDVLVRGFLPLCVGTLAIGFFLALLSLLPERVGTWLSTHATARHSYFFRFNVMLLCASILLLVGYIAGNLLGAMLAGKIARTVETGCKSDCHAYHTESHSVVGRAIIGDKNRTAVYTTAGTFIVKNEDLFRVEPRAPIAR